MIVIGLEDCATCKEFHSLHPVLRYLEIKKNKRSSGDVLKAKKLLYEHNLHVFPIVVNDNIDQVISIRNIDPEFSRQHPKLF